MLVHGVEKKEGSIEFLKRILGSKHKKVYGVFYTNSFFSQRYLCRNHLLNKMEFEEDIVKLTVSTRLENVGLLEIENTLDMLVKYEAGDIPGLMPEGVFGKEEAVEPSLPESVSVTQFLTSVDLFLVLKKPEITYQDFWIAGHRFTLINIVHQLGEDNKEPEFEQVVSLLIGEVGKLYFFSHFHDKELTKTDMKRVLDLIIDENITGKAITGVKLETESGVSSSVFPYENLISSYTSSNGDIVFGTGSGYVLIPGKDIDKYKMKCIANEKGAYRLELRYKKNTVKIYFE